MCDCQIFLPNHLVTHCVSDSFMVTRGSKVLTRVQCADVGPHDYPTKLITDDILRPVVMKRYKNLGNLLAITKFRYGS